jgi:hypothetical protein
MLRRSLFLIIFVFAYSALYPYKNVKVVMIANRANQNDSMGYNVVSGLAQWAYDKFRDGKIKMWATPYKNEEMSFGTLQGMEISSKLKFSDCQNIFLYEIWTSSRTESSFTITGISFSSENEKGDMVSFGYIDYPEIEELLKKDFIPLNENGSYKTTFYQVLMNKRYDFEIVYFKDSPIHNPNSKNSEADYKAGVIIKTKAFNPNKMNLNYVPVKQSKLIEYSIRTTDYDINSNNIISALENYFNKGKKDLYKYGGEEIYNYFNNARLILSECIVKEVWTREGGKIFHTLIQIVPVSVGVTFNPIPAGDVERFSIVIDQQPLLNILSSKQFVYHLKSINAIQVEELNAANYLKVLNDGDWNKIVTSSKP